MPSSRPALRALLLATLPLVAGLIAVTPAQASTVAPGCTDARPTSLGGPAVGSDGRSVNALVGIDLRDAGGTPVHPDGTPLGRGGYGVVDVLNPTLPATGDASGAGTRDWGDPAGTGAVLCVAPEVVKVYVETYPRNPSSVTDKTRYGGGARYAVPVSPGAVVAFAADLPLRSDQGGTTGDVAGTISYDGQPVDASQITRMRAFSTDATLSCEPGISGFSAHYDTLEADDQASDYLLGYLASGRCGAASQTYTLYVDCTCGGTRHTLHTGVAIGAGKRLEVDWAFSDTGDTVTVG